MHTNYVISLAKATNRRKHISEEFGKQSIPFEFYDALMPSQELNLLIQQHLPNLTQANLSAGEKACFMSHFMLWKKCLDDNLPYLYIFEDDVVLGENAYHFLAEDEWLKERFDFDTDFILRLETYKMRIKPVKQNLPKNKAPFKMRNIQALAGAHYGTAGYIISQKAILLLITKIQNLSSLDIKPIDAIMYLNFIEKLNIYQLNPAIIIQENILNKDNTKLDGMIEHTQINKQPSTWKEKFIYTITKFQRMKEKKRLKSTIIAFK